MVFLTRRYHFSASHCLHSESLSSEENARVYGKCSNPYGHGHNYILHVTVAGGVDLMTGRVLDMTQLDRFVLEEVLEPMDHMHLNKDVGAFEHRTPTTENVCMEIYDRLCRRLKEVLPRDGPVVKKVLLEETQSNYFEYEG